MAEAFPAGTAFSLDVIGRYVGDDLDEALVGRNDTAAKGRPEVMDRPGSIRETGHRPQSSEFRQSSDLLNC